MMVIGGCALAVLVTGWLIVSFTQPSPKRETIEWLSAAAMYALLSTLFVNLILRARAEENTLALVTFGFVGSMFGAGLLVTLYRTLTALGSGGGSGTSATN